MRSENSWFHLYDDGVDSSYRLSGLLQEQALALTMIKQNVSVFSSLDRQTGGTHFYFPPEAKNLAIQHGADPCEKPSKEKIGGLLFGDQTLLDRLYQ